MEEALLYEYLVGPAGIAIGAAIIFRAVWTFFTTKVWPVAVKWLDDQNQHMENLLSSHEEDRIVFKESIMCINESLVQMTSSTKDIDRNLNKVITDLSEVKQNLNEVRAVQLNKLIKSDPEPNEKLALL